MKRILTAIAIVLLTAAAAYATKNLTFGWTYPADEVTSIDGYRLYVSNKSGTYTFGPASTNLAKQFLKTEAATFTYTLPKFRNGKHYFVMTAYLGDLESPPSNEVYVEISPTAPSTVTITVAAGGTVTVTP